MSAPDVELGPAHAESAPGIARRLRMRAGSLALEGFFRGLSTAFRLHPDASPRRHGITAVRDVKYGEGPAERLDIYRPDAPAGARLPVVLYIHGGGFKMLSKRTHWLMGLAFARHGYLVFNVDYRLAPRHPFPAAIEDVCRAYEWVCRHAAEHGGDLSRLVVAGESAGGNLAAAVTLAATFRRPEPFAARVFSTGIVPAAVLPACPMLQVSDGQRFARRRPLHPWVADHIVAVERAYLRGWQGVTADAPALALANPLLLLESDAVPERPLPPFFAPVGTADPILDDTRRLAAALDRRGVRCEARFYAGEVHAFHALVFRQAARDCWRDTYRFLDEVVGPALPAAAAHAAPGA